MMTYRELMKLIDGLSEKQKDMEVEVYLSERLDPNYSSESLVLCDEVFCLHNEPDEQPFMICDSK